MGNPIKIPGFGPRDIDTGGCPVNGRVKVRPMSGPIPDSRGATGPDPVGADAEAYLAASEGATDTVELEIPLNDSFAVLLRLAIGDLAREAGLGADQVDAVRDEASQLFADLCRSVDGAGSSRWHFEVIPGALKVVARPSARPADVAVRAWVPVHDVA
jgi:hypothetical protein